jgi:hypothetical protein
MKVKPVMAGAVSVDYGFNITTRANFTSVLYHPEKLK